MQLLTLDFSPFDVRTASILSGESDMLFYNNHNNPLCSDANVSFLQLQKPEAQATAREISRGVRFSSGMHDFDTFDGGLGRHPHLPIENEQRKPCYIYILSSMATSQSGQTGTVREVWSQLLNGGILFAYVF